MILVYSAVLSAYVYKYVALHIRRCLKWRLASDREFQPFTESIDHGGPSWRIPKNGKIGKAEYWQTNDLQ